MRRASRVVVVVFDGLRPDFVRPDLMPRLAAFAGSQRWFREARSVFPSMTRVATTSIATGAPPRVHGIVGNAFYDRAIARDRIIDTSRLDHITHAEAVLGGDLVGVATFADVMAEAGLRLAVVHTGSAGSAYAINPRAARHGHWTFAMMGADHSRTPEAVREAIARFGPLPPRELPRFAETDYAARVMVEHVLADLEPDVALIWFNEPDTSFHYRFLGTPETLSVIRHVDAAFGRILDALAARPGAEAITVIAASDHGQISSHGQFDMAAALTASGHPAAKAADEWVGDAVLTVTGGNMGEIRVVDGDVSRRDAVARWLMEQPETGMVFTPSDDPVMGQVPGTLSLGLVGLDHPDRAPDLVYVLRSDCGADAYGLPGRGLITGGVPVGGGMHGGLNRHEVNTLLVLGNGADAGRGAIDMRPCGIIDIAPTVLDLLGLPRASTMVGRSLLEPTDRHAVDGAHHHATGAGAFRQSLSVADRDGHAFPLHGGRA
ncbi:alkaline phosphatase family protein [Phreatobacter sp.]|uniref:alkaline phosphatase family protein n=1 Tax=Phreatobacter sp. TaxID=1966341 RepID=UPI003F72A8C0